MPRTVLHVGCGPVTATSLPRYFKSGDWRELRFDIEPNVKPDIVGSMTDMHGVETGSMDAVLSRHNLEHLYAHEVGVALKEFRRVLKPSGFAVIVTPDMTVAAEMIAKGEPNAKLYNTQSGPVTPLDIIFGHQVFVQRGWQAMQHRTGFVPRSLCDSLTAAGFHHVEVRRSHYDVWSLSREPHCSDHPDLGALIADHRAERAEGAARLRAAKGAAQT